METSFGQLLFFEIAGLMTPDRRQESVGSSAPVDGSIGVGEVGLHCSET